jgi:hypothetical protein
MEKQLSMDHPIAIRRMIIKRENKDRGNMLRKGKPNNGQWDRQNSGLRSGVFYFEVAAPEMRLIRRMNGGYSLPDERRVPAAW